MNEKVFKNDKLSRFYVFSSKNYRLSMTACCMYFNELIKMRKKTHTRQQIIWEQTKIVKDVWNKADCYPYTWKHKVTLFENNV